MGTGRKHWGDKAAREGTGHPTSQGCCPRTSVLLKGTSQHTDRIWDLPLPLYESYDVIRFTLDGGNSRLLESLFDRI